MPLLHLGCDSSAALTTSEEAPQRERVLLFLGLASLPKLSLHLVKEHFVDKRLVLTDGDLQESLNRFESVVETANDAVICLDEQGSVIYWNGAAASIFGYSADEVVGRPFSVLTPEHVQDSTKQGLDSVISTSESDGVGRVVEMTGLKSGNREFPMALSLAVWQSEEGIKYTLIARDMTERKRVQAEQVAKRQKMAALARNVIQTQERERLYLSGEIEDRLIQGLVSAIHNLESVDISALPEAEQLRVREIAMNLREKAEDGQQLLDEIEPVCRPDAALHGIIKRAVDLVFWRTFVKTSIEVPDTVPDVSQSLKLDILRIAEEGLVNIRKHAQATRVWVAVKAEDHAITLEIGDDGVGFDVQAALSEKEGNYGLLTMQQRSVLFGGDLTIESTPGEGTTVRATFPLD